MGVKYQNNFKKIDTPEKAYFLGFMYGDGCITESKNGKRFSTKISIKIDDAKLIETLNKIFPIFNKGEFDYSKYKPNSGKQIYIRSSSKELFDDLKLHGLYTRKSYDNKEFLSLPNLKSELMKDFIRGFFDADGTVYKIERRKNLLRAGFSSNSNKFIHQLDEYLKSQNIHSWEVREKKHGYEIEIIQREEILKLRDFMYYEGCLSLQRKKETFDSFRIVDKVKERAISCPSCGSHRTTIHGHRKRKNDIALRMQCEDCTKRFTNNSIYKKTKIKNPANPSFFSGCSQG